MSQQFKFKVGDRVTITFPGGYVELGKVEKRLIEEALGKVYSCRNQRGRWLGHVPEGYLEKR